MARMLLTSLGMRTLRAFSTGTSAGGRLFQWYVLGAARRRQGMRHTRSDAYADDLPDRRHNLLPQGCGLHAINEGPVPSAFQREGELLRRCHSPRKRVPI